MPSKRASNKRAYRDVRYNYCRDLYKMFRARGYEHAKLLFGPRYDEEHVNLQGTGQWGVAVRVLAVAPHVGKLLRKIAELGYDRGVVFSRIIHTRYTAASLAWDDYVEISDDKFDLVLTYDKRCPPGELLMESPFDGIIVVDGIVHMRVDKFFTLNI